MTCIYNVKYNLAGVGDSSFVGGLCPPAHRGALVKSLHALKTKVEGVVVSKGWKMLEAWRFKLLSATPPRVGDACVVLAHQGYLFYDAEFVSKHLATDAETRLDMAHCRHDALSAKALETLVTCEIYLTHNYTFDMEPDTALPHDTDKKKKNAKKDSRGKALGEVDHSLHVSQLEVFDLYSRHRARILRWIEGNGR